MGSLFSVGVHALHIFSDSFSLVSPSDSFPINTGLLLVYWLAWLSYVYLFPCCYDPNITMSQQAICSSVITPNSLSYLVILITPHYLFVLFIFFPIVNLHPQSPIPGPCSVLFSPSSIKPHIMYSSPSVRNHTKSQANSPPLSLSGFYLNPSVSTCPKYRDRMSE